MNLKEWIKEKGWSITEFSKRFGVSRGTVYLWFKKQKTSKYTAKRIEEFTNGKVKYKEISKT